MNKINYLRGAFILAIVVANILFFTSCTSNKKEDTKEIAEDRNEEKFDDNDKENDAQFLVNAAEINLEEIQLGKLAQQNGMTSHVKELGKMMEDAHTKSLNDLMILAKSKNITIPNAATNDAKDAYDKMNKKTGKDFDKAYADMMVDGHKDAIETFEKASEDSKDADIKNWASTSLPNLRTHLDHSVDCQKKCEKI